MLKPGLPGRAGWHAALRALEQGGGGKNISSIDWPRWRCRIFPTTQISSRWRSCSAPAHSLAWRRRRPHRGCQRRTR